MGCVHGRHGEHGRETPTTTITLGGYGGGRSKGQGYQTMAPDPGTYISVSNFDFLTGSILLIL